jgi:L-fuconolactonase
LVAAMDKVGVDSAIFISAFSTYRYDASYAVEVQRPIPAGSPSSSRSIRTIRRWPMSLPTGRRRRARSGIPIMLTKEGNRAPNDPGLDRILRAAYIRGRTPSALCRSAVFSRVSLRGRENG